MSKPTNITFYSFFFLINVFNFGPLMFDISCDAARPVKELLSTHLHSPRRTPRDTVFQLLCWTRLQPQADVLRKLSHSSVYFTHLLPVLVCSCDFYLALRLLLWRFEGYGLGLLEGCCINLVSDLNGSALPCHFLAWMCFVVLWVDCSCYLKSDLNRSALTCLCFILNILCLPCLVGLVDCCSNLKRNFNWSALL